MKCLLCLNVYFPCDDKSKTGPCDELHDCFASIDAIVTSIKSDFVIFGDLNCDFGRGSAHTAAVKKFMLGHKLNNLNNIFPVDYTFSWDLENGTSG